MNFKIIIQDWFKAKSGGSLFLPDGWFGKPHDNLHSLTSITEQNDKINIILDDNLKLDFYGLKSVKHEKNTLIFRSFDKLIFEWGEYGNPKKRTSQVYYNGEVKIIS